MLLPPHVDTTAKAPNGREFIISANSFNNMPNLLASNKS